MRSVNATKTGIRRILKRHQPQIRIGDKVELMVYLNYLLFLKRLAQRTLISMEERGIKTRRLTAKDIEIVSTKLLEEFRG